jgi:hypothetical protein
MPIYPLRNTETNEIFEKTMKIAEYEDYIKENPHIQRYYATMNPIIDPMKLAGRAVVPGAFNDLLNKMATAIPQNTINQFRKFHSPREW